VQALDSVSHCRTFHTKLLAGCDFKRKLWIGNSSRTCTHLTVQQHAQGRTLANSLEVARSWTFRSWEVQSHANINHYIAVKRTSPPKQSFRFHYCKSLICGEIQFDHRVAQAVVFAGEVLVVLVDAGIACDKHVPAAAGTSPALRVVTGIRWCALVRILQLMLTRSTFCTLGACCLCADWTQEGCTHRCAGALKGKGLAVSFVTRATAARGQTWAYSQQRKLAAVLSMLQSCHRQRATAAASRTPAQVASGSVDRPSSMSAAITCIGTLHFGLQASWLTNSRVRRIGFWGCHIASNDDNGEFGLRGV
jgi:hypothetical protein